MISENWSSSGVVCSERRQNHIPFAVSSGDDREKNSSLAFYASPPMPVSKAGLRLYFNTVRFCDLFSRQQLCSIFPRHRSLVIWCLNAKAF